LVNPEKAAFYPRFFKTGPGQYGEGDKFLGVVVPNQRRVARQFRGLPRAQIDRLLNDPFHECRLTGLFILVSQFERSKTDLEKKQILDYYLARTDAVNNWDLVDGTASQIVGAYLSDKTNRSLLRRLSRSKNLLEQRIAIVATYTLIKQGEFGEILELAESFLDHSHDLIHKAVGWMLREAGKQDRTVLTAFLDKHAGKMPRTMLRYSLEKLPEAKRRKYMSA
jgi:3-methyladenine DNA glycosylase AlkD